MRIVLLVLLLVQIVLPTTAEALQCGNAGFTVIYVNGILTNEKDAQKDTDFLETKYKQRRHEENTKFLNGYNESHLGGGTDIIQSAAQAFGTSVSDFDRNTILMQIQPQVSTRKILLLGHSQGTFYTNEMYKYLIANGVPRESIAVYNLATPADRVEGGGQYLTSSNDKLINGIRPLMSRFGANLPLPANITIPLPENELTEKAGGHHFSSSYLAGAPDRIVGDITNALEELKADTPSTAAEGCFNPPPSTLVHKAKSISFAIADPVVEGIKDADIAVVNGMEKVANAAGVALGKGIIITVRTTVYVAKVTANAIVAAARKAKAAAEYAASLVRNILATKPKIHASSQLAGVSPALLNSTPAPAAPPAKSVPARAPTRSPPIAQSPPTTATNAPTSPPEPVPVASVPASAPVPPVQPIIPMSSPALGGISPGFGGGGGAPAPVPEVTPSPSPAPVAEVVIVPLFVEAPLEAALFATSSVTFSGTTTPGYSVVASFASNSVAASADAIGNWSIALELPDGTTSIGVVAADSNGNTSESITRNVIVDHPPAAPSPSIPECSASLSTQVCIIPITSAALEWSLVADAAYYAYALNGVIVATTTETMAAISLAANATSTFSVAAYDAAGNAATSSPVYIYVETQPLIINEIAWAGTEANSADEWIELKSNSMHLLNDLSSLTIVAADNTPYIQLSGAIARGGYYLIERREESTSVTADLILAFDELSNVSEKLRLQWGSGSATTTMDISPECPSGWCYGVAGTPWDPTYIMSMERMRGGTDGAIGENWQNGINTDGTVIDSSGNSINGTPRAENSEGGLLVPPDPVGML